MSLLTQPQAAHCRDKGPQDTDGKSGPLAPSNNILDRVAAYSGRASSIRRVPQLNASSTKPSISVWISSHLMWRHQLFLEPADCILVPPQSEKALHAGVLPGAKWAHH